MMNWWLILTCRFPSTSRLVWFLSEEVLKNGSFARYKERLGLLAFVFPFSFFISSPGSVTGEGSAQGIIGCVMYR